MNLIPHDLTPDFSSSAFQDNLYRHYKHYLEEKPVFRSNEGVVYITRYKDCTELLSSKHFGRVPPTGGCSPFNPSQRAQTPLETMISQWMIFMDAPRHDVIRKAFQQAFSMKSIKQLDPFIRLHARQLLDTLPQRGNVEMLENFAFRLPVLVIAEILGVPHEDADLFNMWSTQLTQALDAAGEDDIRKGAEVALLLKDYFTDLMQRNDPRFDHGLINIMGNDPESKLSADELVYGFAFLLFAGHETTKNLIASGIKLLAERPDELIRLQQQPQLMDSAVEEMLRFETPLQKVSRWSHQDAVFGDYFVPRGTLIVALIGAANRDAAVFDHPDTFDMARTKNRHIAFGTGIHHCLGALVARLEGRIAFSELVPRLRRLEPVHHHWRTYSALRSLDSLSVKVELAC